MSDRIQYSHGSPINGDLLNQSFASLEQADRNLATDIGLAGILTGFEPRAQTSPNLTIHLSGPGLAYDSRGRRIFAPMNQTVDCRRDVNGQRTEVSKSGYEVWLSVAVTFTRRNEDMTQDTGEITGITRQWESFSVRIRRGEEAPAGHADKPMPEQDTVTVCHVKLAHGAHAITSSDIDITLRDKLALWRASAIKAQGDGWQKLPSGARVEDVLSAIDVHLSYLDKAHRSLVTPGDWKVLKPANTVQEALDNIDGALQSVGDAMGQMVRPSNWKALPDTRSMQSIMDAVDGLISRQAHTTKTLGDSLAHLATRLDAVQRKTHPRAHRVHECVYYARDVEVPALGPRDTRVLAVRLADVQASDVPGFARPMDTKTARQLQVQILATLDGLVRLAFTNLTSHFLRPGLQTYEIGLWVPDVT